MSFANIADPQKPSFSEKLGFSTAQTLLIGLGNPILGDDGIGWRVVEAVTPLLDDPAVTVRCFALGGLSLMEQMVGYQRAIIVDSIQTVGGTVGDVYQFTLDALPNPSTGHSTAIHDTSLQTALEIGRTLNADLPTDIQIVAVEAAQVYDFSDELSPPVATAIPDAVEAVLELLNG
jgi:hydrogenase maturation protease